MIDGAALHAAHNTIAALGLDNAMELWDKSSTVDAEVRAYVYSLVNAVGGQSSYDDRYALGDDALAVLHDLLRWLRLYDEKTNRFDVKRCLAEANLVKGDLLEILALWPEEAQESKSKSKLALACLQLLVPLTWPMELDEEKSTVNHHRHMPFLQLAQVGYKRAILHYEDAQILRTAIRVALPAIAQPRRERSRRDEGVIRMMLYLFRNTAMIIQPQHLPSQGDENEISRSATIEAFHQQDVFSLLLTIGSGAGDEFQEQDVIVLEILFHLLKGVDAKKLFMREAQLASNETDELQSLLYKEKALKSNYKKHAPSRHNRFGTMLWVKRDDHKVSTVSGQNAITNRSATLERMDASKKVNKPKYRGKMNHEAKESTDVGGRVDLTEKAREPLRSFVEDILDSSFNPLFASLRKGIEREVERVTTTHRKQYFYLISWFLSAEAARREQKKGLPRAAEAAEPIEGENTFTYIAAVLDQETFVLLSRNMQRAYDEKCWQELQAILLCFTRILLTVQDMAESTDEEDQEIAENIQSRIFYEESTHDLIVQILRGYKTQSFAFLDAVTECAHVFVRMLERYSKQNADLQIRSKRRARKKKKVTQPHTNDAEEAEEAAEEEREVQNAVSERKFDFARFSSKFLTQGCADTFIALLNYYADLTPAQLKRCHRYLYRLAFKNDLAVLLFRVDILKLLHQMIKGPSGLDSAVEEFKEWETLVQQIFRRCIKWIERASEGSECWREAAIVEMLFSKIPRTVFHLQNGHDQVIEKRPPRPPAELELKASVKEEDRLGMVVGVLLEVGKDEALQWTKREVKNAADERTAWEGGDAPGLSTQVQAEDGVTPGPTPPPTILLSPDNEERKMSLFKDKHLRLLLTTLGLERLGTAFDVDASWIFPSELTSDYLKTCLAKIHRAEFDPPSGAQDQIRNKSTATRRSAADFSDAGSAADDDDDDDDAPLFPPNARQKRKGSDAEDHLQNKKRRLMRRNGTELTDKQIEERAEERRRKERERNSKIKSQLLVTASDDESDAEADAEFFRLEAARRNTMKGIINATLRKEKETEGQNGQAKGKKTKGSGPKTAKRTLAIVSDDEESMNEEPQLPASPTVLSSDHPNSDSDSEGGSDQPVRAPSARRSHIDFDAMESDAEETTSTPPPALRSPRNKDPPLSEVSPNIDSGRLQKGGRAVGVDDEDEDDAPVVRAGVRRRAGPFIVDEDSDEE